MKKICVYTCITGNYENLKEIEKKEKEIDYYCFTNNKNLHSNSWKIIYISNNDLDDVRLARKIKILGHKLINENYDISVWIDAAFIIKKSIVEFINKNCDLKKYNLITFKHSRRNCIYDEALECIKVRKDNYKIIKEQMDYYKSKEYPCNNGLVETGIIVRKINSEDVIETMQIWFELILKFSKRDQLSFNYAAYESKLNFKSIELNIYKNDWFEWMPHKNEIVFDDFRAYFGDEKSFDLRGIFEGNYTKQDNLYCAEIIVPKSSDKFKFEFSTKTGIVFSDLNIEYDKINSIEVFNYYEIYNKKIFYNSSPIMLVKGNFKKKDKIKIYIRMNALDADDYFNIIKKLSDNIEILNLQIDNLNNQYEKLKIEHNIVINSKGWRLLERIRKIFKK